MAIADALSTFILIIGTITSIIFVMLACRSKELRGLHIIIAFGCAGLACVFALNSMHIVINTVGLAGGRPWTIIVLSGIMGLGLYRLRNRGGC